MGQLVELVRARLRSLDPDVQVMSLRPFAQLLYEPLARPRFYSVLMTGFGATGVESIEQLPQLGDAMAAVTDRYLTVQQDILETCVDRGQLRQLAEPRGSPTASAFPA